MFIGKLQPNCRNIPMILTSMSDKQTGEMKIFTWRGENKEYSIEPLDHEQGTTLLYKSLGIIPMPNREQTFKKLFSDKVVMEWINRSITQSMKIWIDYYDSYRNIDFQYGSIAACPRLLGNWALPDHSSGLSNQVQAELWKRRGHSKRQSGHRACLESQERNQSVVDRPSSTVITSRFISHTGWSTFYLCCSFS